MLEHVHVLWRQFPLEWLLINMLSNGWVLELASTTKDRLKALSCLGYVTHLKVGI
jgi:hypothetical protein